MRIDRRVFLALAATALADRALARPRLLADDSAPRRALVLGAGISGLYAARLLEQEGCAVTVLEARPSAGGRLRTLPDLPGRPEAGGQVIAPSYTRVHDLSRALDVRVTTASMGHGPRGECTNCHQPGPRPGVPAGPGSLLFVNGRRLPEGEWAGHATALHPSERAVPPSRLLASYLSRHNPLDDASAWITAAHQPLDKYSIEQFVRMHGASDEAVRLMNVAPNCPDISSTSVLWALRDEQRRRAGGGIPQEFADGSSALIEAVVRSLKGRVLTGRTVGEIASTQDGVQVRCHDGEVFAAALAICALPLPALRAVTFATPLPDAQADAIRAIPYTPITKVFLKVSRAFWEDDGWSVSMWTDTTLDRVFPLWESATDSIAGLVCFADGAQALELDALPDEARARLVVDELIRVRPSARGAVSYAGTVGWSADALAGGAYPAFAPGQVTALRAAMALPQGRLTFAGEHASVVAPGIEGALESAERAVKEALAAAAA